MHPLSPSFHARCRLAALTLTLVSGVVVHAARSGDARPWQVGTPIVTYWAGPAMSDAVARQMAEGGWNVVWCGEKDLDLVHRHGLRAQLTDPLLAPATLDDPARGEKLDALLARVRGHPALYAYFITDEPNAAAFPALGRLVAYLRDRDPAHLAYINLYPTYATNEQLGNRGDTAAAYREHLGQYVAQVKPALISYDHYQFTTRGDSDQYFLNLALIREAAEAAGLPFLNIVQACTWTPSMRVPTGEEMRFLVYTTLAYGAQGISYYVYCHPGHTGGIAHADGSPTPWYAALKSLNREFVAIARELAPLRVTGVYHAGMMPPGAKPLPADAAFSFDPPVSAQSYQPPQPVRGAPLGSFAKRSKGGQLLAPTHALVVNLDYSAEATVGVRGPGRLEVFDAATGKWSRLRERRADLRLLPGGGKLVRLR